MSHHMTATVKAAVTMRLEYIFQAESQKPESVPEKASQRMSRKATVAAANQLMHLLGTLPRPHLRKSTE